MIPPACSIAGIAMAIRLKRDYGFDNFTVSLVMRSVLRKTGNILIIPDIRESGICWGNVEGECIVFSYSYLVLSAPSVVWLKSYFPSDRYYLPF